MGLSEGYLDWVLEQLGRVGEVSHRKMFGGAGIYGGDAMFAMIADDVLYFKVDDSNRGDFESLGMQPFRPYGEDTRGMNYYQVPADVLEDPTQLEIWMRKALAVAASAKKSKSRGRAKKS